MLLAKDKHMTESNNRGVCHIVSGLATSDGAGVQLTRYIGSPDVEHFDPFLLLDFFESDNPNDYIAGFPSHPHRGFETVTYLLAGKVRHEDSAGHGGVIETGGIQWMTAGRGIIHSEMPEQEDGRLAGFQLWVNLPAVDKMCQPTYHEYPVTEIPLETRENGATVRVITGNTSTQTQEVVINDVTAPVADLATLDDVTAECEVGSLTAPTATDNCDGAITGTTGVTFPITESTTVTWTYEDASGNISNQLQNIVINDITVPIISCPSDQTVLADEITNQYEVPDYFDNGMATTSDNCDPVSFLEF